MHIVNTYVPGHASHPGLGKRAAVMAVLASPEEGVKRYSVYLGIITMPETDEARAKAAEWVGRNGTKLNLAHAKMYFPALTEDTYNR